MPLAPDRRDELKFIALSLDEVGHGQRRALIEQFASKLALSPATLYRQLEKYVGWTSGRKTRADKGTTRVPEANLEYAAAIKRAGVRQNDKETIPTCVAASIMVAEGLELPVGNPQLNRLMRARRLDTATQKRDTPAVSMRSLHPNHVHQVDPSLCLVYYDRHGQQVVIRDDENYKNKISRLGKLAAEPRKVWRYVLTDHTAGTIIPWYVAAKGETQKNLFEFLMFAWAKHVKGACPECGMTHEYARPFHGVPRLLMMDPGSANTAHSVRNLLKALQVELIVTTPRNARAKGSVENAQNLVETHFESRLRFRPAHSVEEMNDLAFAWANAYNANLIPRVDSTLKRDGVVPRTRYDMWLEIQMDELRLRPARELCLNLLLGAKAERKVTDKLTVMYRHPQAERSSVYDVSGLAGVCARDVVEVWPMVYGRNLITVRVQRYDGAPLEYRLEPIADFDSRGFRMDAPVIGESHKAHKDTEAVAAGKALDRLAYGDRSVEEIKRAKDTNAQPFAHANGGRGLDSLDHLKAIQPPEYIPRKGEAIELPVANTEASADIQIRKDLYADGHALDVPSRFQVDGSRLGHVDAAMRLRLIVGEAWSTEMFARLTEIYPDGLEEDELGEAAARLLGNDVADPARHLRAVK